MRVDFRFTPPRDIAEKLGRVRKAAQDFRPVWRASRPNVTAGLDTIFRSKGRRIGEAWNPLSERYRRRKKGGKLLVLSGKLQSSVTGRLVGRGRKRARYEVSRLPYAPVMNFGFPKRNIPPRGFAGWSRLMKEAVVDNFRTVLDQIIAKLGA